MLEKQLRLVGGIAIKETIYCISIFHSSRRNMSVKVNWQTTRPTIRERTKFMFNNHLFSDVKFVARTSDGESESKRAIPAHKFVLSIGSPVFEAMLYGELAETRDTIELPDCEYESLLELFRYIYSDEVNLSGSTVMGVLYLAKKYMVPSLVDKCTKYLHDNLDASNVFDILPTADKYEEKDLVDQCWEVIDKQTKAAVDSDCFVTIQRSILEAVAVRDSLSIEEVDLFQSVDLWATKQCEANGSTASGELKRRILGERIIKAIRFPVMTQREFAAVVVEKRILTPDEVVRIFLYFSSTLTSPVGFPETKRSGPVLGCGRFESVVETDLRYDGREDFVDFTVDKDITLHGVCLCGSNGNDYTVTLELWDKTTGLLVGITSRITGTFSSRLLKYKGSNYYGFKVLFDSSVALKKNITYIISATITGPPSWKGVGGIARVQSSGVTFHFNQDCHSIPPGILISNQLVGQFPEFLFSV